MTMMTLQTMLWCLFGFLVGAIVAYLLAKVIAPSRREALQAASESARSSGFGRSGDSAGTGSGGDDR